MDEARAVARERHRQAQHENALSKHPRHMDDFDAGWEAGVIWAQEQHQSRPIIACGGCGMRLEPLALEPLALEPLATDAGGADGSFICPSCLAVNRGDQSFRPGQYRQARGIAPPAEGDPSVEETMRKMRDDP